MHRILRLVVGVELLLMTFAGGAATAGVTVSYSRVAQSGDPAPGGGTLQFLDPPVLNETIALVNGEPTHVSNAVFMATAVGLSLTPPGHPELVFNNAKIIVFGRDRGFEIDDMVNDWHTANYALSSVLREFDALQPVAKGGSTTDYSTVLATRRTSGGSPRPFTTPVLNNNDRIGFLSVYDPLPVYLPTGVNVNTSSQSHHAVVRVTQSAIPQVDAFALSNILTQTDLIGAEPPDNNGEIVWYYFALSQEDNFGSAFSLKSQVMLPRESTGSAIGWYAKRTGVNVNPGTVEGEAKAGGLWCGTAPASQLEVIVEGEFVNGYWVGSPLTEVIPGSGVFAFGSDNAFTIATMNKDGNFAFNVLSQPTSGSTQFRMILRVQTAGGTRELLAREHDADVPGAPVGTKFANLTFAPVINNTERVAFRAQTTADANGDLKGDYGVWTAPGGSTSLTKIAYHGDAAPGMTGATFVGFGDPVVSDDGSIAFAGRYEKPSGAGTVLEDGVYIQEASLGYVDVIARTGANAPSMPSSAAAIGTFVSDFGDPSLNDTNNAVFRAGLNITNTLLRNRLDGAATVLSGLVVDEGIFQRDNVRILRTVAVTGMTMGEMVNSADPRILVDLQLLNDRPNSDGGIIATASDEGRASGHQDGRRIAITNWYTEVTTEETCDLMRVAFQGTFADPTNGYSTSTAVFVAEYRDCEENTGGGCQTCLCSPDPNCMMGGMLLGSGPDFNGNGLVDSDDLALTMTAVGYTTGRFDINGDGLVDSTDVAIVAEAYKMDTEKQAAEEESK